MAADAARESRRQQAVQMLQGLPSRRFAAVAGDPIDGVIPIMVGVRTADHGIVTGELTVPADRWDPWLFLRFLQDQDTSHK